MEKKSDLEQLKVAYKKLQKKYGIPEFDELNLDFSIEKISTSETDFLAREIRKYIAEKFSNYLRMIETLLHPVDAQMFVFAIIKSLGVGEKKTLSEIYKKLAELEISLIELDLDSQEEKEVEFIKKSYKLWTEVKRDLLEIMKVVRKNWDVKTENNGKNYFG